MARGEQCHLTGTGKVPNEQENETMSDTDETPTCSECHDEPVSINNDRGLGRNCEAEAYGETDRS